MIKELGPVRVRQLLERFGDSTAILRASRAALQHVHGIGPELSEGIANWEKDVDLSSELKRIEQSGCHIVLQSDENYPPLLKQIYDPPVLLYVLGSLTARDKNLARLTPQPKENHHGFHGFHG